MDLILKITHELQGNGFFLGRCEENACDCVNITLEDTTLHDKWAYLEFQKDDGSKYSTERLTITDGVIRYDVPNGLLSFGHVKLQVVLRDDAGFVWKSFVRKFVVSPSLCVADDLPEEYPDFITEAQILLDECSSTCESMDEIAADLTERVETCEETSTACNNKVDTYLAQENQREVNEEIRGANESTRQSNESTRQSSENARDSNESERINNESTRESNEAQRVSNESTRQSNESQRVADEAVRVSNESTRVSNEVTRVSNESTRQSNEQSRQANETARINAEAIRVSSESQRVSSESTRQSNEVTREANESIREANEDERVAAETDRQTNGAPVKALHSESVLINTYNWRAYTGDSDLFKDDGVELVAGESKNLYFANYSKFLNVETYSMNTYKAVIDSVTYTPYRIVAASNCVSLYFIGGDTPFIINVYRNKISARNGDSISHTVTEFSNTVSGASYYYDLAVDGIDNSYRVEVNLFDSDRDVAREAGLFDRVEISSDKIRFFVGSVPSMALRVIYNAFKTMTTYSHGKVFDVSQVDYDELSDELQEKIDSIAEETARAENVESDLYAQTRELYAIAYDTNVVDVEQVDDNFVDVRATPNAIIGSRSLVTKIEGKTITWNQLCENGNFVDRSSWNLSPDTSIENNTAKILRSVNYCSITKNLNNLIIGHKYIFFADVKFEDISGIKSQINAIQVFDGETWVLLSTPNSLDNNWNTYAIFATVKSGYDISQNFRVAQDGRGIAESYNFVRNVMIVDLTAIGREDITTLEQFKTAFHNDYYHYDSGSLKSVSTSGVKTSGKNLYADGDITGNQIYSLDFKEPLPAGIYNFSAFVESTDINATTCAVSFSNYDADVLQFILLERGVRSNYTVTLTCSCSRLYFYASDCYINGAGDDFSFKDIQIEQGTTATAYEPYSYTQITYPQTELKGVGTTKDSIELKKQSNGLYSLVNSTKIRSISFNGTEGSITHSISNTGLNRFTIELPLEDLKDGVTECICSHFEYFPSINSQTSYMQCCLYRVGSYYSRIYFTYNAETVEEFSAYLASQNSTGNPVTICYEMPTPPEPIVLASDLTYEEVTLLMVGGQDELLGNDNASYGVGVTITQESKQKVTE